MSNAVESAGEIGGGDRPAKKPKHNEIEAFGGPMDDEETARKKLKEVGFDPDTPVNSASEIIEDEGYDDDCLPMPYFCQRGDLRMCRYLLSKGTSTTQSWVDDDNNGVNHLHSPMYAAVLGGHLDVCKWLCEYGARGDIRKTNASFSTPLYISMIRASGRVGIGPAERERFREICRWLILNEALCPRDNGFISDDLLEEAFSGAYSHRDYWVRWAEDAVQTHDGLMTFLMGTYLRVIPKEKHKTMNHCALSCLSGHPGIRKHIADMLGVVRGRDLRIMRELRRKLSKFIGI